VEEIYGDLTVGHAPWSGPQIKDAKGVEPKMARHTIRDGTLGTV